MDGVSLLTIVKGRRPHLDNLIRGVAALTQVPAELVIVHINEELARNLPDAGCRIVQGQVQSRKTNLPLAKARNYAAELASSDLLVFLDVDCIPAPDFLARLVNSIKTTNGLVMGTAHYLPANSARSDWHAADLAQAAVAHPRRPRVPKGAVVSTPEYHLFWSLCFGLWRDSFDRIGGFDEAFRGYGGEDTDFAFSARAAGIPFYLADARCYHQHHATCSPPYNHLRDIITNARAFHKKWNIWPMEGWLQAFHESGHVRWDGKQLELLRLPDRATIAAHRSTDPFA